MTDWTRTQLTFGSDQGRYHSHSYYDVPVMDPDATRVVVHELGFTERQPTPRDAIGIGIVRLDAPGEWDEVGRSRAWSWQQGPMAQWIDASSFAFNDREEGGFVARVVDAASGKQRTLPRPIYAVSPDGRAGFSLNMARLDTLRPGYGYADGEGALLEERAPSQDGVWRMDLATGEARLVLSLAAARDFVLGRLGLRHRLAARLRPPHYWFNHVKVSPSGERFTVKLRWRVRGSGWNDRQGVSLTAGVDGSELRLLADATSHVIWLNDEELYAWRRSELALFRDGGWPDNRLRRIAPSVIEDNVHMRHVPPGSTDALGEAVFDTPYREAVDLLHYDDRSGAAEVIATFGGHRPARGPFRCDLHPCPSRDGRTIIVTSMCDGGRQVYALSRGSA